MKRKHLAMAVLGIVVLGIGKAEANQLTADETITVTPIPAVSISVDTGTYPFGSLDVSASSISATAVTLNITSDVNLKINKDIETQFSGWVSSAAADHNAYALYVATATVRPTAGTDFVSNTKAPVGSGSATHLTGILTGSDLVMSAGTDSTKIWFRLDMPTKVDDEAARSALVRFTALPQ